MVNICGIPMLDTMLAFIHRSKCVFVIIFAFITMFSNFHNFFILGHDGDMLLQKASVSAGVKSYTENKLYCGKWIMQRVFT